MFKFLRKYNKWILAVGGGLLMIVFLLGETLPRMTEGAGAQAATRATLGPNGSEKIRAADWARYDIEAGFVRNAESRGQPLLPIGNVKGTEHWLLLVREAQQAGLVSSPGSIQVSDDEINGLSAQGINIDDFRRFSAHLDGVMRLLMLYVEAADTSDHRLRDFASRVFHKVNAEIAVITASAENVDDQPTERQLAEHLEKYKDFVPGEGEMGLGYKMPDRVKIEWLKVNTADVREQVAASEEMDGVALRYHWQRNPHGTFPPFEETPIVPFEVREDLLSQLTEERLQRISNFINAQLAASRRGLEQREGYFQLPEDWEQQRLPLPKLAQEIQEQRSVPLPEYRAEGEWLEVAELDELDGIGSATTDRFGAVRGLRDLVAGALEFGGSPTVAIQSGIASPPLQDDQGSIYVFRILDTDPSRAATSVDEVREQLVADLKRIADYERLVENASSLKQAAIDRGMLALAIEHDAELAPREVALADLELTRMFMQVGQSPQIFPTTMPVIGQHRDSVEAIVDHARGLPTPIDQASLEERTLVIPIKDHLAVLIARIESQKPLSREQFAEVAGQGIAQRMLFAEELEGIEHVQAAFSLATLREKHNLRVFRSNDEAEDETSDERTVASVGR